MLYTDISNIESIDSLIAAAQESDTPLTLVDGEDECLVVLRPSTFERILFEGTLLGVEQRKALRF